MMLKVTISTVETELEFFIPSKTTGKELFDQVSNDLGIREKWYFGLRYSDDEDNTVWIDQSKKTVKSIKSYLGLLKFRVKYYPEDVSQELIEDITIRYFYLQVRSIIITETVYCPPETCILLASFYLQAKYGDFILIEHEKLQKERLLPEKIYQQYDMNKEEWENNVTQMWLKHKGIGHDEAMMEYLKIAQDLEMYGVQYFHVTNAKGSKLMLGVNAFGLNVYKDNKLNPDIGFPWSEIDSINYNGKKFIIKTIDKKGKNFVFFSANSKVNSCILELGIGNHCLYIRRRKPDTLGVTSLKTIARSNQLIRIEQRNKLLKEIQQREELQKKEEKYKEQVESLRAELFQNQTDLLEAQFTIRKLREQLHELHTTKEEMESKQEELREMMLKLEQSKNIEVEERRKLEMEIEEKQAVVEDIQNNISEQQMKAEQLQEEMKESRRREDELQYKYLIETEKRKQEEENVISRTNYANEEISSLAKTNAELLFQLKDIQDRLAKSRVESQDTELDRIHRENVRENRDKYKTLKEIRTGNTIRRVDMFENM